MWILTTCLLSLFILYAYAQNAIQGDEMNFQVIPPGPEASSLGSFVDVPVGLYTGKVDISVPLYTLKSYILSLPISLSYNSSGIKVEEIASFAGAGWSLNAGGMISRSIRGKGDEDVYGYFSSRLDGYFNADGTINSNNDAFTCASENERDNVSQGEFDFQPDSWFFSFGG